MPAALTSAYFTIEDLRLRLGIAQVLDGDVPLLVAAGNAACRQVDGHCGRRFTTDTSATARIFAGTCSTMRLIDDCWDDSGVTVETSSDRTSWTTLAADRWFLGPADAEVYDIEDWPYWNISATSGIPFGDPWVRVTAKWGWAAVPEAVREAALIQAVKLYLRKNSGSGVEYLPQENTTRVPMGLDRDAAALLGRYCRADRVFGFA